MTIDSYVIDSKAREREAFGRIVSLPFLLDALLEPLGLAPQLYWVALGVQHRHLNEAFEGDVDLMVGPLAWSDAADWESRVTARGAAHPDVHPAAHRYFAALEGAASGGIKWPPDLHHLVAIEAKAAY